MKKIVVLNKENGKKEDYLVGIALGKFLALYAEVHRDKKYGKLDELKKLRAILESSGCWIEHAWGVYLHTPDNKLITLDYWNDEQDG